MIIKEFIFDKTSNGVEVKGINISNGIDTEFTVINRGATLTSFKLNDSKGKMEECILGFDNIKDYEDHLSYYGATIGRVSNRIANATFELDGKKYNLAANDNGKNCLHGGAVGFDKVMWDYKIYSNETEAGVIFYYLSKDGEENFPGNLQTEVKFSLNSQREFVIEYKAETDKKTPVSLTNHAYWNLSGFNENVHTHNIKLDADTYLPVDEYLIPTGEIKSVENTPFDLRKLKPFGEALKISGGFDHNFNLSLKKKIKPENRIYVEHLKSGRSMEIKTTEPAVQVYTGFDNHDYFCVETQMYNDAVNESTFESIILCPGEVYKQITIHKFDIK